MSTVNPTLRLALSDLAKLAATDPSATVELIDHLRAELDAQRGPFSVACKCLVWGLGAADEGYCRSVEARGTWSWQNRCLEQEELPLGHAA